MLNVFDIEYHRFRSPSEAQSSQNVDRHAKKHEQPGLNTKFQ